jgi:hypothetical protein
MPSGEIHQLRRIGNSPERMRRVRCQTAFKYYWNKFRGGFRVPPVARVNSLVYPRAPFPARPVCDAIPRMVFHQMSSFVFLQTRRVSPFRIRTQRQSRTQFEAFSRSDSARTKASIFRTPQKTGMDGNFVPRDKAERSEAGARAAR